MASKIKLALLRDKKQLQNLFNLKEVKIIKLEDKISGLREETERSGLKGDWSSSEVTKNGKHKKQSTSRI